MLGRSLRSVDVDMPNSRLFQPRRAKLRALSPIHAKTLGSVEPRETKTTDSNEPREANTPGSVEPREFKTPGSVYTSIPPPLTAVLS